MQRIAFGVVLILFGVSGCATTPETTLGPLPGPILHSASPGVPSTTHAAAHKPAPSMRAPGPRKEIRHRRCTPAMIHVADGIAADRWQAIVVHHSAAPTATPKSMHRYHKSVRQWEHGLGYHFVIGNGVNCPDGKLYIGPRWLRQETGAHCKTAAGHYCGRACPDNYFNEHGIGICLVGNFEHERPTDNQLETLRDLICVLIEELDLDPQRVYGHGEVTGRTACPGIHLDMNALRQRVVAHLNDATTPTARRNQPILPTGGR